MGETQWLALKDRVQFKSTVGFVSVFENIYVTKVVVVGTCIFGPCRLGLGGAAQISCALIVKTKGS